MTPPTRSVASVLVAFTVGVVGTHSFAGLTPPTEHAGLRVQTLGTIDAESMQAQIGSEGRILLLRAITIEPGGQIARHGHGEVPGLVKVISGEWIEGRASGETRYDGNSSGAILEDKNTVHWFYNRGDVPATAIVCDIRPGD